MRIDDPILLGLLDHGLIDGRVSLLVLVNLGQLNCGDSDHDCSLLGQVVTLKKLGKYKISLAQGRYNVHVIVLCIQFCNFF